MTTDTELDRMYQAAVADEWEEQNKVDRTGYDDANKLLDKAKASLQDAVDFLSTAAQTVEHSPEKFRISSLMDEVHFLMTDIQRQKGRMTA